MQKISSNPFVNTQDEIIIPSYSFSDGIHESGGASNIDSILSFKGNCCSQLYLIDRYSSRPEFQWHSIENTLIVAAIFDAPVELFPNGLSIKNTGSIVWAWDSGMGSGEQSGGITYISYDDGKKVIDSKVTELEPDPLVAGKLYVWCVWAWNTSGTLIEKASPAIPFVVDELNLETNNIELIEGSWEVESAIRKTDSKDVKDSFPFTHLSITLDCLNGTFTINSNQSKTGNINLRENRYVDFLDADLALSSLEIEWLCNNTLWATTFDNGSEIEILLMR